MTNATWRGILAPLNTPSTDGRTIAAPSAGAVFYQPMPLPLLMPDIGLIGSIEAVWIENGNLMAEGTTDYAPLVARLIVRGWFTGGIDLAGGRFDQSGDTITITDWQISGFNVTDMPAFEQTRLEYWR